MTEVKDAPTAVRSSLERLLNPRSIALVGLNDTSPLLRQIDPTFESGAEIFFVNPKYDTVRGERSYPRLTDIGQPIDSVMCCVSARVSADIVEEAAGLDIGGCVLTANGFSEFSEEGAELQARLKAAATRSGMALIGPNGLGMINVRRQISLTLASHHKRRPGGVSLVSHSGAILSGAAMAAWEYPDMGLNVLISAGNEAGTDLADYVDHFVDDPNTNAVGLIMEKIRRPAEFFAAVERATEAGKPIVVMKLARNEHSQKMAASHTGALTGDAWVYDVALRQAGVALAYDVEELIDRLALVSQVPPSRWTEVRSLAVLTRTGGFASLAADLSAVEGTPLAALDDYADWIAENLPGVAVANPLDAASFGGQLDWSDVVAKYVADPQVDAVLMIGPNQNVDVSDLDGTLINTTYAEPYVAAAEQVAKPCIVANCSGTPGDWIEPYLHDGVLVRGRGLRPSLRGLATLGAFFRHRNRPRDAAPASAPLPRPAEAPIPQAEGPMLSFAATMKLLSEHGIPVAPFQIVEAGDLGSQPLFEGPYVVKLADVAHRTEHDAVRLSVEPSRLEVAIGELQTIAARDGLEARIAVQPMLEIHGEALLGVQGESELGPLVLFGLGGIFVEVLKRVGGRMAPLSRTDAVELIEEFEDVQVMRGFRGRARWDLDALADILVGAGQLAVAGREWLASLDVNPLVWGPGGFQAVDALLLLRA
jgi:acyl-CoA synthetase (NDP forming)